MKQIAIISGKGGTGKTVISAALAALVKDKVMVDCDVDAANLYLLLSPEIQEEGFYSGGKKASVDLDRCTGCGSCLSVCRFSAIEDTKDGKIKIDPISCEGCAVCSYICPAGAISMKNNLAGRWFISSTKYGPFVHARLGVGEENSGKLVSEVRKKAKELAENNGLNYVIIDGPPGIGCPVIAALSGVNLALIVTEPTLSGSHDMERVIQVARHFGARVACALNKFDLNVRISAEVEKWCQANSVPVVAKIPFSEAVVHSVVSGKPVTEAEDDVISGEIKRMWAKISEIIS
ncbi:MAG: ATP-binding protein [Candidatus Saccharicenans sp.]|jgi:MinD superfamily P-loop ATPase|nr:ATP-binding protein [Candidatus Saccharicenans sp.]HNS05851.1 ATP-binding protein [Candidatus Saccharicenans sp.]